MSDETSEEKAARTTVLHPDEDPLWYKDAIIYEVHVRAFADSNGDGIGDFRGLTGKLDYLQELGVTALWLLPFYPSPLRDDGYDIADYRRIHPDYGTMRDFRRFLKEAHRRGLKVINELVINHTSDQHPWFQRARRAKPGSVHRDYYVWSDDPERYAETRIIFKDFESSNWTWDPLAQAYYWHRFYHHQPDLNFDSPRVRQEVLKLLDFWFELGVDGMRLDAIPYLFEREGTNCENLPETHEVLKELRRRVDERFDARMFLAEANQWPEDAAAYFGDGDECHMNFHFPLMPRLYMALRQEDRFPILDILQQTPEIPESCQWAVFLRNHDELTLEMVTDEDRDYMYRAYAADPRARINLGIRRRLAPLLGNDRRRIELLNALLFAMPGTPVLYYGDEIGMGDNFYLGDRNGVRTPMQWSPDRNAGFSRANPQRLYLPVIIDPEYHYEAINVEALKSSPSSLLWWMRRLIALRKQHRAFGRGTIEFLHPDNHRVLAFLRRHEGEEILVVANLSRYPQHVELDLSRYEGREPVELFGLSRFPRVGELPYLLTLGPHGFYWFSLSEAGGEEAGLTLAERRSRVGTIELAGEWHRSLAGGKKREADDRAALERGLAGAIVHRRWFGGKARTLKGLSLESAFPLGVNDGGEPAYLVVFAVQYAEGEPERYALPLTFVGAEHAERFLHDHPEAVLLRVTAAGSAGREGLLYDALWDAAFRRTLLDAVRRRRGARSEGSGRSRELKGFRTAAWAELDPGQDAPSHAGGVEQSNTSVFYGDRLMLKLIRRLEPGANPDLEVGRHLTETVRFEHVPAVAGGLELREPGGVEPTTVAIAQAFVANEGDAWSYTLDALGRFFERVTTRVPGEVDEPVRPPAPPEGHPVDLAAVLARGEEPAAVAGAVGLYLPTATLLGRRTAQLHAALATPTGSAAFDPEPFGRLSQRSLYQSMRSTAGRTFQTLGRRLERLPESVRGDARRLHEARDRVLDRFGPLLDRRFDAVRTRIHGDYHLGQVLYTGRDFVIIDFEGEPARPLGERRLKRSPLADVAGMLRSFHYASEVALTREAERGTVEPGGEGWETLAEWARFWHRWVSAAFLRGYLDELDARRGDEETAGRRRGGGEREAEGASFLPEDRDELAALLDVYLLEKAVYELGYELSHRPDWLSIPLTAVAEIVGLEAGEPEREPPAGGGEGA